MREQNINTGEIAKYRLEFHDALHKSPGDMILYSRRVTAV